MFDRENLIIIIFFFLGGGGVVIYFNVYLPIVLEIKPLVRRTPNLRSKESAHIMRYDVYGYKQECDDPTVVDALISVKRRTCLKFHKVKFNT